MRSRVLFAFLVLAACGDNKGASTPVDGSNIDGKLIDAAVPDSTMVGADANPSDQLAAVKAAADGTGLSLPVGYAIVTYLKPQIGSTTNDPAGFTIQAQKTGPGIFVALDPAAQTPALVRGDVINFKVTDLTTVGGQKRITGISNLTRLSQGFDVSALSQEVSTATDLVTNLDAYESELIDISGTLGATFSASGAGFEKVQLTTTGMPANASFVLRVPTTLRNALDITASCMITLNDTPVGKFFGAAMETQLTAFTASDIMLTGCGAPTVVSAVDLTATTVRITFSRNVLAGSVLADGSQFTFDNGLVATAATVSGRTVTVTTSAAQTAGTPYTVTVAATVTDLQGSPVATPNTATFLGFEAPAQVRINEVNALVTGGCDLIELRVLEAGTLRGIRVQERNGGSGELREDLPSVTVAKNDIVVLHINATSGVAGACNTAGSTNETTSISQNPVATFAKNYDTAWDLFSADTGLTSTDNVITVFDRLGVMKDVVFIDDDMPGSNVAASTETAAAAAALAMMWQIVGGGTPPTGFVDDDFRNNAVIDSDATGTASTGDSLRRIDDTDENDKADWAQGASSFGVINAGQAPLP